MALEDSNPGCPGYVLYYYNYRNRSNIELYELLNDMDILQSINIQWLRCIGHVVRIEKDTEREMSIALGCLRKPARSTTLLVLEDPSPGSPARIITYSELYKLLNDMIVVQNINTQRLRGLAKCRSKGTRVFWGS